MVDRSEYIIDHAVAEGMESLLAESIKKYPILYDKTHKYRFQSVYPEQHEKIWNQISDELNLELESCKSLWSCMKQKFIKHRKRLDKGEPVASWPTYDLLQKWLDKHVKKRRTRHDYIKQMKNPAKTTTIKTLRRSESNFPVEDEEDDADEAEDEWTDLMEDKNTMVKIQLKRTIDDALQTDKNILSSACSSSHNNNKKKFKIEVFSEQGTEIFNDNHIFSERDTESQSKDDDITDLSKTNTEVLPHIEVIELKEANVHSVDEKKSIASIDASFLKLEQFLTNCLHLIEKRSAENVTSDSNDFFGKYIASMIRELPSDKRMKIRLNILQYTSELIAKETSK